MSLVTLANLGEQVFKPLVPNFTQFCICGGQDCVLGLRFSSRPQAGWAGEKRRGWLSSKPTLEFRSLGQDRAAKIMSWAFDGRPDDPGRAILVNPRLAKGVQSSPVVAFEVPAG